MLILLTRVDTRSTGVAGPDIEDQVRTERMRPRAAIIPAFAAATCRSGVTNRIKDGYSLLSKAEEKVVAVAESMIDSELPAVGVIQRRPALGEVILRVATKVG